MGAPVVHFEVITSQEASSLQKFYADAFDWKVDSNNPMNYGVVDTGAGTGINGGIGPSQEGNSYVTFYVEVPDLQAALDKIEELGGKTVFPPTEIPNFGFFAQFQDPHGNLLGLFKAQG